MSSIKLFMFDKYVYIIKSQEAEKKLLGRRAGNYLLRELASWQVEIISDVEDINYIADTIIVLYEDMPLVTKDILNDVIGQLNGRGLGKINFLNGYAINPEASQSKNYFLKTNDFLRLNDTKSYDIVYNKIREKIINRHLLNGALVTFDCVIDDTATIKRGAKLLHGVKVLGDSYIGKSEIENSKIENSFIGDGAKISYSVVKNSKVNDGQIIEPFSKLYLQDI